MKHARPPSTRGLRSASGGRADRRPSRAAARPHGRQARRPGPGLRRRLGRRLPSLRRLLAGLGAVALAGGMIALVNGPYLRVAEVAWAGERYTSPSELSRIVEPLRGASVLTVDTGAVAERVRRLPAVSDVRVDAGLPGSVAVTITEKAAAFVWQTSAARLIGAADGTLIGGMAKDGTLPGELAVLPFIDDRRAMARLITVGDTIVPELLATAQRLAALDPALLGSRAGRLSVRLDDVYGFLLVSADPAWSIAFGFYGRDPAHAADRTAEQVERQAAAVRTLFAAESEADIEWVDARNPGKVYFRARG